MYVLIVESPAKAKAISQYLGKDFKVLSSFGHVRALPTRKGSVDVNDSFKMFYELTEKGESVVPQLIKDVKNASKLYLATDPDREGEAISWHLFEVFKENNALPKEVHRIVFNEVTKTAVQNAITAPRKINDNLVQAQRLRQALDYLVGFSLSPVLWKKLPGSRSAGRVQSVALRMLCERENEIGLFVPEEYWSIDVNISGDSGLTINTQLTHIDGEKLEKTSIKNAESAQRIIEEINSQAFKVDEIKKKEVRQRANPPFITSTMQQAASTFLGFNVKKTMSLAQKLYEGVDIDGSTEGLITYMRTDATYIAADAINAIRRFIQDNFSKAYLPDAPIIFKKKVKNAQEAHEAIRPTNIFYTPEKVRSYLTDDQYKLYKLIWERSLACQMSDAVIGTQSITFVSQDNKYKTTASASTVIFDGFHAAFSESRNKEKNPEVANFIAKEKEGSLLKVNEVIPKQNFTEPPHRYSEAGLIKQLEELGIGRPSTYATVISVLQEREYASIRNKAFIPENRGRIVSEFLVHFFSKYVEYHFTAELEDKLDRVADGAVEWLDVIEDFWSSFSAKVEEVEQIPITQILGSINEALIDQSLISKDVKIGDECSQCGTGKMSLNVSRYGVFLGCTNYPTCKFIVNDSEAGDGNQYPKQIGEDIALNRGPYGLYLKYKGRNIGIPSEVDPNSINEEFASRLVELPKVLGRHPKDSKEIKMNIGPYGLYLLWNSSYYNLQFSEIHNMTLEKAIDLIENYTVNDKNLISVLGCHEGEEVQIRSGRYGAYIKCGKINAPIPKSEDPSSLSLEMAISMVEKKKSAPKTTRKALSSKSKSSKSSKATKEKKTS